MKTRKSCYTGGKKISKCKKPHKTEKNRKKYVKSTKNDAQKVSRNRLRDLPYNHVTHVQSSIGVNFYKQNKYKASTEKRMIVIDGSNVAFAYTNHKNFAPEGIDLAVRFVDKIGHETKVVLSDFREKTSSSENIMRRLKLENKLILTPSKNLPDRRSSSYEDRFILQIAMEFDAAIISNDNYREFINESPEFKKIIENRVIGYVFCKDLFMVPTDPYGPNGPSLQDILNRRN